MMGIQKGEKKELVDKNALENALKAYMRRAQNVFDEDMPFVLADFQNLHSCAWIGFRDAGKRIIVNTEYELTACWTEFPSYLRTFSNRTRFYFYECVPTCGQEVMYALDDLAEEDFPGPEETEIDDEIENALRQIIPGFDDLDEDIKNGLRRDIAGSL